MGCFQRIVFFALTLNSVQANLLINPSFEANTINGTQALFSSSEVPGWTSLNGEDLEMWKNGHEGVNSQDGNNFFEIDRPDSTFATRIGSCRTEAESPGTNGQEFDLVGDDNQASCEQTCAGQASCLAYEYSDTGSCELWRVPSGANGKAGAVCNVKIPDGIYQYVLTETGKQYELSFFMRPRVGADAGTPNEAVVVEWNGVATTAEGYNGSSNAWTRIVLTVVGTGNDRLTLRESTDSDGSNLGKGPFLDNIELSLIELSGGGGGDPHFKTWSGIRYDYHGECDLVFLQNPYFDHGQGLHIHIRTVRKGYYSYIERAGIQVGNDILEFAGIDEWYKNGVKASKRAKQRFGKYKVRVHSNAVSIRIDEKNKVKIDFNHRRNGFLYLDVDGKSTDIFKGSLGMIGEWGSGLLVSRDGETIISDPDSMAQQWQVRDTDPMLFRTQSGPQYPVSCRPPLKMLGDRLGSSIMRRRAEHVCKSRPEKEEAECVFDVMATRDINAAAF